jgi:hypothetical protein
MPVTIKGHKVLEAHAAAILATLGKDLPEPLRNLLNNLVRGGGLSDPALVKYAHDSILSAFGATAGAFSEAIEADLGALGHIRPGQGLAEFKKAMSDAFAFGFGAHLTAVTAELIMPLKHLGIPTIAALMAEFSGFKELVGAYHGPLIYNAIRVPSMADHAAKFRSRPPAARDADDWLSRRLITPAAHADAIAWSGLMPEYEAAESAGVYRPLQPRMFATLLLDQPFPAAQVKDALEYAGIRPADVDFLLPALELASTKNVRQQFLAAVVRSAELGTTTPAELDQELTLLNFSDDAKHWVQLTVATRKLQQLAELYRKSISEAYKYGQITDQQYVPSLEAIGIARADAEAHYAIDSIAKSGKAAAAALKAEERLAAQRMRAESNAAIASFRAGATDAVALEAGLLAAGMDPVVSGFVVAMETARQSGNEIFVYGLLLPRKDAVLLREKVTAVEDQFKKQLIDDAAARAALAGLGIPAANALALIAAWAALKTAPTKHGELLPR